MHSEADSPTSLKHPRIVLIGIGMSLFILNLDLTIVNLALPTLSREFHANLTLLQWINNIYSLIFAALVVMFGKAADRYGHRGTFIFGIATFLLGSVIAGFATGINSIIVGRMFQGLGMGAAFVTAFTLIDISFEPKRRSKAIGIAILFTGLAQAIGPTLGGYLVEYLSWRWAFLINIPFCLLGILIIATCCGTKRVDHAGNIHVPSVGLYLIALFALTLAGNQMGIWGIIDPRTIGVFAIGVILLAVCLSWQKRLTTPLIDLSLFRHKQYLGVSICRPLMQSCFGPLLFLLPLYLQNVIGYTPFESGLVMVFLTASLAITSPIAGHFNHKYGPQSLIVFAMSLSVIGYILLTYAHHWDSKLILYIALMLLGIYVGCMFTGSNFLALHTSPEDKKGAGFGLFTSIAFFSYSLSIAISGYLFNLLGLHRFYSLMAEQIPSENSQQHVAQLEAIISGAKPITTLETLFPSHPQLAVSIGENAFAYGFSMVAMLMAALSLLGLVIAIAFKRMDDKDKANPA